MSPLPSTRYSTVSRRLLDAVAGAVCAVLVGCHQDMYDQVKHEPLEPSAFFPDGRSSRPLEPGVIARGTLEENTAIATGKQGNQYVNEIPLDVNRDLLARGRERYNIFCTPCHGLAGSGDGIVVERGFSRPPSYHSDRLRGVADGQIFDVITNGLGAMPSLRDRIPVRDRWAIVSYVRALQLSQAASVNDLSAEQLETLTPRQRGGDVADPRP